LFLISSLQQAASYKQQPATLKVASDKQRNESVTKTALYESHKLLTKTVWSKKNKMAALLL
jgi:hypothetical protein